MQMTIRLPDDLAEFVDQEVENGTAQSRAAMIARALRRERRRKLYAEEAARLAALPPLTPAEQADEDALGAWAAENAAGTLADLD